MVFHQVRGLCSLRESDSATAVCKYATHGRSTVSARAVYQDILLPQTNCQVRFLHAWIRSSKKVCLFAINRVSIVADKAIATEQKLKTSILNWLSPLPTAQVHQTISDRSERGSGAWFLTSEAFRNWLNDEEKQLWCWGIREHLAHRMF